MYTRLADLPGEFLFHLMPSRDESVLPLIQDSIDELFLLLDVGQINRSHAWPVFRTLAQSCERWRKGSENASSTNSADSSRHCELQTESNEANDDSPSHMTDHVTTPEAIEEFFLKYHREKQRQDKLGDLGESELNEQTIQDGTGEGEGEDPYNQSKQLSPLSHTVVEVMQRCAHHMSSDSAQLRVVVLETLSHCLVALQHEQVSNVTE